MLLNSKISDFRFQIAICTSKQKEYLNISNRDEGDGRDVLKYETTYSLDLPFLLFIPCIPLIPDKSA
jgi:hypothetical protein